MNRYAKKRVHKRKIRQRFLYKFGSDCPPELSRRYWLDYSISNLRRSIKSKTSRRIRRHFSPSSLKEENHPGAMRGNEYRRVYDRERSLL